MYEHLVDDDLKEQRRYQPQQLDEQGGHDHLGQQTPVFEDLPIKPRETEALILRSARCATREQHDVTTPTGLKLPSSHLTRTVLQRIKNQHLLGVCSRNHDVFSVSGYGDGWQRRAGELSVLLLRPARF